LAPTYHNLKFAIRNLKFELHPMTPIPYGRQEITEDDLLAVREALLHDFLTQGPAIAKFEQEFAAYVCAPFAQAVANGTAALHLCALALGVKPGTKVLCTPITFAASSNCVLYCGGTVEFVDVDASTGLMDLDLLEQKLGSAPAGTYAGVIPVHLAGNPVDMRRVKEIATRHQLWVIEDACHAPGATTLNADGSREKVGSGRYADLSIFSFHPVKHIATGEGGAITTARQDLYHKIEILRTHGITKKPELMEENHGGWYYEMQQLGYNYRITDFQCALGSSQLARADKNLQRRRDIAARYDRELADLPIRLIRTTAGAEHGYHLYVILTDRRKELYDYLRTQQIFAQVHYIPVHTLPYYRSLGWKKGDFPQAEQYYSQCLSIPMYHSLTDEQQTYVIEKLRGFWG
jgi:UDP-4-amino-4,6-dideoxy-N-acetyl-beta-L-altrosamine transaminase